MDNPYEPPTGLAPAPARAPRPPVVLLAAFAAWIASAYWAVLTALLGLAVATTGAISPVQLILPAVLIGLYAVRGYQLFRGERAAATRLLWLHAVGGLVALSQLSSADSFFATLQGIKIAIHVLGIVSTFAASRALGLVPAPQT